MPVTMKELAFMAGVSRATVDRVLNNRGRVSNKTAERIKALSEKMGYKPNLAAKSLAVRNKKNSIGFIVNREGNLFFEDVISGAIKAAKEHAAFGISVEIKNTKGLDASNQVQLIDELVDSGISAIAITPINDLSVANKLNETILKGIPVLAVTADISDVDYLTFIGCNHEKAGHIAGNLAALITNKEARIGVVIGSRKMLGHALRLKGFENEISKKYPNMKIVDVIENDDDNIISYNKISALLDSDPSINFLFFASAGTSGGIRAVIERNKSDRIKIISFDLTEKSKQLLSENVISAVLCQEPFSQGYTAIKILSDYLLLNSLPKAKRIYTRTEIIISQSLEND